MSLKEYNTAQVAIFKRYSLTESDRFIQACQIIAKYRECNNQFAFVYNAVHELRKNNII
jgi:hypothetical protein